MFALGAFEGNVLTVRVLAGRSLGIRNGGALELCTNDRVRDFLGTSSCDVR